MKKLFFLLTPLLLLTVSACGTEGSSTVSLDGSTSMEQVIGALIEGYGNTGTRINYSGTGSGAGIEAVLSGICDIGLSSRALKESEIEKGAQGHLIALDGIAVIVNAKNVLSDLTTQQLRDIFTARVTNWAQLGGSNAPIAVYGREAGSGTREAFETALGIVDRCIYINEYGSNGDIIGNVSTNPNAIGYVSLPGVNERTKAVSINGIPCSAEAIRSGSYPLQRPFFLVTDRNRPLSAQAQAFLNYATNHAAAQYIEIAGAVAPNHFRE